MRRGRAGVSGRAGVCGGGDPSAGFSRSAAQRFEADDRAQPRQAAGDPGPEFLAIDGNRFRTRLEIPYRCIVKGDGKYADIAAASVLAKTHRDEYMMRLAEEFPQYGWMKNKGYPTREHRLAIREYGLTPHHRLTFNHEIDQLEFPF